MLIARARFTFIATPPQVSQLIPAPVPPPDIIASAQDFRTYPIIGAGGSVYIHGNPPIPPNNTGPGRFLSASTPPPPPYPGSVFIDIGGTVSTPPHAPPPLTASTPPPPPYPGSVFIDIGGGDLNPTHYFPPLVARTDDFPTTLRGSSIILVQKSPSILQTPPPVIALQSYVPLYPGSVFIDSAPIDNGSHRFQPLIAVESPRPYPLGSTFATHGPPDNGLLYPRPISATMASSEIQTLLAATGSVWMLDSSQLNPGPTLQIIPFTVDLAQIVSFTLDMGNINQP